jgi:dTDP-4-amino-4,6-dideoxygalactose transaminase
VIPFNRPVSLGTELVRICEAVVDHGHTAGGGPFGLRCEALLEQRLGRRALLTSSCTHALEMAALLLRVGPGDEVVLPSFTFVSTATAFAMRGARLRFVDVDAQGSVDVAAAERALTPRTRAVVAVHYAGASCDLGALAAAAGGIPLVEDAAQAIGAAFDGRPLGTFGKLGTLSFHETKNVGCGEGGALVVNDPALIERAEYLRDKGTNRRRFLSGLVDKYTWVDDGSSYVLSDINAAFLHDQLVRLADITSRRAAIWNAYRERLEAALVKRGGYIIRPGPRNPPNYHLFALVFRQGRQRDLFIQHMREHGILAPFHYVALHLSPKGREHHEDGPPLPWAEKLTECLVRLPLFFNLKDAEVDEVARRALEFIERL